MKVTQGRLPRFDLNKLYFFDPVYHLLNFSPSTFASHRSFVEASILCLVDLKRLNSSSFLLSCLATHRNNSSSSFITTGSVSHQVSTYHASSQSRTAVRNNLARPPIASSLLVVSSTSSFQVHTNFTVASASVYNQNVTMARFHRQQSRLWSACSKPLRPACSQTFARVRCILLDRKSPKTI
ncbi:hypothetical protein ES702_02874 [subsurface metagenome]